jgi:hypothetical protein
LRLKQRSLIKSSTTWEKELEEEGEGRYRGLGDLQYTWKWPWEQSGKRRQQ